MTARETVSLPAQRPRGHRPEGRADPRGRQARRHRDPAPLLQAGAGGGGQLPRLHGRDRRRARAGAVVLPRGHAGHEGQHRQRARAEVAEAGAGAAAVRHARGRLHAPQRGRPLVGQARPRQAALRGARAAGAGPVAPGHRRQPGRLHPVHALPARLPRRAGQRRHRPGLPRRAREDRLRHGRPDGRVHLRGLRRMCAGLPDRRADAGARRGAGRARQAGRVACARTAASAASSPTTSRTTRSSSSKAATARPTTGGCASRGATASTMRTTRSA